MKRHSAFEVTEKLRQAEVLAARGQSQSEICKALGVSLMTFHRWRKSPPVAFRSEVLSREVVPPSEASSIDVGTGEGGNDIETLRLENQRLRRIVTDLLLEKMRVQELMEQRAVPRRKE